MGYRTGDTVPIFNYTRGIVMDRNIRLATQPYCKNYLDQTNCTDVDRVGGRCLVKGFETSISKYIASCDLDDKVNHKLCDDGIENACIATSSNCKVHKHKLCDGEFDCTDKSDEYVEICNDMTK